MKDGAKIRKMFRKSSVVTSPEEIYICNKNFKNLQKKTGLFPNFSEKQLLKQKVYQYYMNHYE